MAQALPAALAGPQRGPLRLAVGASVLSLLLLLAALAYLHADTIQSGERSTAALAHLIEEQTSRSLQAVDSRLELAGAAYQELASRGPVSEAAGRAFLRGQISQLPLVRAMWILDAQGRIVQDSDVGNVGVVLADRAYFRAHQERPEQGFQLANPVRSRTTGGWLLSATRALPGPPGRFEGVIVAAVEPPYFDALWRSVELGREGVIALVRREGTLLMRSPFDPAQLAKPTPELRVMAAPFSDAASGSFEKASAFDGVRRQFSFRRLSVMPDLMIVVGQARSALLAGWQLLAGVALLVWAAASALLVWLGLRSARELSARLAGDQVLRANEERLRALLGNLRSGVVVHDPDARIVQTNPAACALLGLSEAQLQGRAVSDPSWGLVDADHQPVPLQEYPVCQVLNSGQAVPDRLLGVPRSDAAPSMVWLQCNAFPLHDAQGALTQVVVTFADRTAQKRAQDELQRINRNLRVLASVGTAFLGAADEAQFLDAVCRHLVAAGDYPLAWIGLAQDDAAKSVLQASSAGPETAYLAGQAFSWDLTRADGSGPAGTAIATGKTRVGRPLSRDAALAPWAERALKHGLMAGVAVPLASPKRTLGALMVYARQADAFDDLALGPLEEFARHVAIGIEALRARSQRDAADLANRAKSAFLAHMSHEIRTPINAIMGMNHLLRRSELTAQQRDRVAKVDAASHHLLALVNDVLDLSKIEAGAARLQPEVFPLSALLDPVQAMVADAAQHKGLALMVEQAGAASWLKGDLTRLRQALLNLVSNALKFTEQGSVSVRAVLQDESPAAVVLKCSVTDTGVGIAPADQHRVFGAFEQALNTEGHPGGTGLGLAITQRLAQLMGGDAGVVSQVGQGSTFWFTARLERAEGDAAALPQPASADAVEAALKQRHAGAHILLAEDNPVNRELVVALLEPLGLPVDCAADGEQALVLAGRRRYALVLMDMQMPRLDGLGAARRLRDLPGWQQVPIVALTANAFSDSQAACLDAGMNDFLSKPLDPERLHRCLLRWLDATA